MARRYAGKANPRSAIARSRDRREKATPTAPEGPLKERLAAIEQERDALRSMLERERARIRKLEDASAAARNRIAWALDSLQNILDAKR
jgi:hypothetical protein